MRLYAGLVNIGIGVSLLVGAIGNVSAAPIEFCDGEYTTIDLNNCTSKNLDYEDSKLNSTYKTLRGMLDRTEKDSLKQAQLAWIDFRDKSCNFTSREVVGGSMHTMIYTSCLTNYTYQRRIELQKEIYNIQR